ncbi:MAG: acyl carrier protein [Bdellovibrionaceae bacterium]|nr:acyl carrier protein [Pseudobdellovibrionaceae bacterium]
MKSMNREDLEGKVIAAYEKEFGASAMALDTDFAKLGFNSLQRVRLLFVLEEALDVDLADLNLHECQTLREVIDRLDRSTTL